MAQIPDNDRIPHIIHHPSEAENQVNYANGLKGSKCEIGVDVSIPVIQYFISDLTTDIGIAFPQWSLVQDTKPYILEGTIPSVPQAPVNIIDDGESNPSIAHEDAPFNHYSHDLRFRVTPDENFKSILPAEQDKIEVEWETGLAGVGESNPIAFLNKFGNSGGFFSSGHKLRDTIWNWPSINDRVHIEGNWVWDRGHVPKKTELHPPRLVAIQRDLPSIIYDDGQIFKEVKYGNLPPIAPIPSQFQNIKLATRADIFASGDGGALWNNRNLYPFVQNIKMSEYDYSFIIDQTLPSPSPKSILKVLVNAKPGDTFPKFPTESYIEIFDKGTKDHPTPHIKVTIPWKSYNVPDQKVFARSLYLYWDEGIGVNQNYKFDVFMVSLDSITVNDRSDGWGSFFANFLSPTKPFFFTRDGPDGEYRLFSNIGGNWIFNNEFVLDIGHVNDDGILEDGLGDINEETIGVDALHRTIDFFVVLPHDKKFRIHTGGYEADFVSDQFGKLIDPYSICDLSLERKFNRDILSDNPTILESTPFLRDISDALAMYGIGPIESLIGGSPITAPGSGLAGKADAAARGAGDDKIGDINEIFDIHKANKVSSEPGPKILHSPKIEYNDKLGSVIENNKYEIKYWLTKITLPQQSFLSASKHDGFFVQSSFGTKDGNFEVVVPRVDGGFNQFWREDKDPLTWHGPYPVATDKGKIDAISLIQSTFTDGGNKGNLDVVARMGDHLVSFWRSDKDPLTWHGPFDIPNSSGSTGNPSLIQSTFTSNPDNQKGNFEVVVPRVDGGFNQFWREDKDPLTWHGPYPVATDKGKIDAISLIQSTFTDGGNKGNLDVVARMGDHLVSFWRSDKDPLTWHGPFDIPNSSGSTGNPSLIQSTFTTGTKSGGPWSFNLAQAISSALSSALTFHKAAKGNFEVVVPRVDGGFNQFWREDKDPLTWHGPYPVLSSPYSEFERKIDKISMIQSTFSADGKNGNLEVVACMDNYLVHFWKESKDNSIWHTPFTDKGAIDAIGECAPTHSPLLVRDCPPGVEFCDKYIKKEEPITPSNQLVKSPLSPVADPKETSTKQNIPVEIRLSGKDPSNKYPLTFSIVDFPKNGEIAKKDLSSGMIEYKPKSGYNGVDNFTYNAINNENVTSNKALVKITIGKLIITPPPENHKPTVEGKQVNTTVNTPIDIDIASLVHDDEQDDVNIVIDSNPSNGVTSNVDQTTGTVTYTPNTDFSGDDEFTYKVHDPAHNHDSNTATIKVTVIKSQGTIVEIPPVIPPPPENEKPTVTDTLVTTPFNTPAEIDIKPLVNDKEQDDLNIVIDSNPSNGGASVDNDNGIVTYTPNTDFSGDDEFTYKVHDPAHNHDSNTATIKVTVIKSQGTIVEIPPVIPPPPPENEKPTVTDTLVTTPFNTPAEIDIKPLVNDKEQDDLNIVIDSNPSNGGASVDNDNGIVTYTPNTDFSGDDEFTYKVHDPAHNHDSNTATIKVTVIKSQGTIVEIPPVIPPPPPENEKPTVESKQVTTEFNTPIDIDIASLVHDDEQDDVNIVVESNPSNGGTSIDSDNDIVTYTPNTDFSGDDEFTYKVHDEINNHDSNTATIKVTVIEGQNTIVEQPENTPEFKGEQEEGGEKVEQPENTPEFKGEQEEGGEKVEQPENTPEFKGEQEEGGEKVEQPENTPEFKGEQEEGGEKVEQPENTPEFKGEQEEGGEKVEQPENTPEFKGE